MAEVADKAVQPWGKTKEGEEVQLITIGSPGGVRAQVTTFGATIVSLWVPDRKGELGDIVLGYDSVNAYEEHDACFGATVGRVANRIAGARFTLDGQEFTLPQNNGVNCLHGGKGFHRRAWELVSSTKDSVTLRYVAKDGEEGFPGNLTTTVEYALVPAEGAGNDVVLSIRYQSETDKPTVINLTNHSYFNLAGHVAKDGDLPQVLDHVVQLSADEYTPANEVFIPTGEHLPVEGTPMDFRKPTRVGDRIDADFDQTKFADGYDCNWILRPTASTANVGCAPSSGTRALGVETSASGQAKRVREPDAVVTFAETGRRIEVFTQEPGVQLYTGNFLGKTRNPAGKGGFPYGWRRGLCLETQHFPNTPNQELKAKAEGSRSFPTTVLRPGEVYKSQTVYWFSAESA